MTTVKDYLDEHHDKLDFYTRAITNAHGQNHPEVFDVRQQYVKLCLDAGNDRNLDGNFTKLRQTTKNYAIPEDVCPVFEATYHMLKTADSIHNQA
ncbi:iron-sulfur cluster repair di-iron protein, ric [Companilactobacillus huachuanensis]|uniref:Iron-sulfur cluster repair di-iron protein, ric n=1 Tax=Companilactobacillus huachuanensis TaxID=2559914 RepID=A0ABW1RLF9_9LACO|nr:iron-sulfur cluster repair di-iron protein, ric [Companilactobacillus huachuanensis]